MIGKKKNCGCSFMEGFDTLKDLTGQTFGKLTALHLAKKEKSGSLIKWICLCECGNTCVVYRGHLLDGHTTSCGCIRSKGEEYVAKFLKKKDIQFVRQLKIPEIKDIKALPFDFGIYKDNKLIGLIEIQGKQHYQNDLLFSSETLIKHDKIKKNKAQELGIPLLLLNYSNGEKTNWIKFEKEIEMFLGEITNDK